MWHYPELDPVAIALGPIRIHWYAISYLVGIGIGWWLLGYRSRREKLNWNAEQISDLVFYITLGVIAGGRLGYMFFYGYADLLDNPLNLFKVWQGGMSFHGGMLGVLVALYLYARRTDRQFFDVTDFMALSVPLGLGSGRIGNFINGELPGRVSDVSWAVIYPGETLGRHPSSLYQAALEGPVLFLIVYMVVLFKPARMVTSGVFLLAYGCLRAFSEFFREPDAHMGFVAFDFISMGQVLSLPMIFIGILLILWALLIGKKAP